VDCVGACGDGLCHRRVKAGSGKVVAESFASCPVDCPPGCGDGTCSAAEKRHKLRSDAWDAATSDLADIFLKVKGSKAASRLANRRLIPVADRLLGFLQRRLQAHRAAGDLQSWLGRELGDDLARKLASPVLPRAVDVVEKVEADAKLRRSIYDLADHLIDELDSERSFRATLTALADLIQLLIDDRNLVPVARAAGQALHPGEGLVKGALRFLGRAMPLDTDRSLTRVLRNAWQEQSPGKSPVQTLLDVAAEVHRVQPGSDSPYLGPDVAQAFKETRDFLDNPDTGLKKFFEIVKNRCGGPCAAQ
jgi:nucleotide-binding universal stress UspA family protein